MAPAIVKALLIEDNPGDARLVRELIREDKSTKWEIDSVSTLSEGFVRLDTGDAVDVVLLDLGLPDSQGLETFHKLHARFQLPAIIVLTGMDDDHLATQALQKGAQDYVVKSAEMGKTLTRSIRYACERKVAEQELERSERWFKTLVEHMWDGIVVSDWDRNVLYASPSMSRMLGFTAEEILGPPTALEAHPDEVGGVRARIDEMTANPGKIVHEIFRMRHKNGTWRWIEANVRSLELSQGGKVRVSNFKDITENRLAFERLEESETRYKLLCESNPLPMVVCEKASSKILTVNDAALVQYGYSREEFLRLSLSDLLSTAESLRSDAPGHSPAKHRLKNGNLIDVEIISHDLQFEGRPAMFLIAIDITKRRQREREIQLLGILALEIGQVTGVDDALELVLTTLCRESEWMYGEGWSVDGGNIHLLRSAGVLDDSADGVAMRLPSVASERIVRMVCEEKKPLWLETSWLLAETGISEELSNVPDGTVLGVPVLDDGELKNVLLFYMPGKNPQAGEQVEFIVAITHELALLIRQKRAESALRESEEKFRLLLDSTPEAIFGTNKHGECTFANPSCSRILGYEDDGNLLGKGMHELLHGSPQGSICAGQVCELSIALNGVTEHHFESTVVNVAGLSFPVEVWSYPIRRDGSIIGAVLTFVDITERKKMESHLLRTQRLESIGVLAGGIAHDLNNVLTPILMSVQILSKHIQDEQYRQILNSLEISVKRGADMVKQVLTFARGVEGELGPLQAKYIIAETESIIRKTFPSSVTIVVNVDGDLLPVSGNATQLQQVVLNMCVNARDAMENGGKLVIEATNELIDEQIRILNSEARPGPYIVIRISDTGTGIPAEKLGKIFDPFYTTKELGKGTGLGLSTAMGIIQKHAGFINVYSEPDKGTEFKIYLPALKKTALDDKKAVVANLPVGHGETILIIDDEPAICQVACSTLEHFGYKTIMAHDGTEGIALFVEHRATINCVLTDMRMPYMDGPSTIKALRKLSPTLKIIGMSGLEMYGNSNSSFSAVEADGFLSKPYTAAKLLTTVAEVLHPPEASGGK